MAKQTSKLMFTEANNPYTSDYDPAKITLSKWMQQTIGGAGTATNTLTGTVQVVYREVG